jgi:hypothetical protein
MTALLSGIDIESYIQSKELPQHNGAIPRAERRFEGSGP